MRVIIFVLIFLLLAGCFPPAPIITIAPVDTEIQWINGIEMIGKNAQGVSMMVGYVEKQDNLLSFNVIIKSESEKSILIDPVRFEFTSLRHKSGDITKPIIKEPTSFAVDPEKKIQQLEMEISRENADYDSFSLGNTIGGALNLISTIASVGKEKTDEEIRDEETRAEDIRQSRIERENSHVNLINSLNNQKSFWQNHVLRKTTLQPFESIEGRVYFKSQDKAENIQLRFPIDSTSLEILFVQKKIQP